MKERIRDAVTTCFVSFTVLVLCYAALDLAGWVWPLDSTQALRLFALTAAIGVLMQLTALLPVRRLAWQLLLQFADVAAVVFGLGGLMGAFPWEGPVLLLVGGMLTFTYFASLLVFRMIEFSCNRRDSLRINRMLARTQAAKGESR